MKINDSLFHGAGPARPIRSEHRLRLALWACALTGVAARGFAQGPVADGPRAMLDLAGTWEAVGTTVDLPWPAPAAGWVPQGVPARDCALIDSDVGRYAYPAPDKVIAADGRSPAKADKQAAWFRRTFELPGGVPAGQRALLHCEGVAWRSAVRLNGTEVGRSILGVAPNTYDVTAAVRAGANELVIGATCRAGLWDAEHKTFIAPTPAVNAGIWGAVRLELVPEMRIDDLWVRTSVARKRIEVELTLANLGAAPRAATPAVVVRGPDGQPAYALAAEAVTLAAGETRSLVLAADWLAPHLWTPTTPVVYTAEATLRDGAAVADRLATPFGFREFTAVGRDFQLNGRRQVLLRNSWLTAPGADRETVYRQLRDETAQFNCIRLHIGFIDGNIIEQSDRAGMLVVPEFWAWYEGGDRCWPITQADVWLPAAQETMARLVKRYRNNPSVVMWSLANETFWDSTTSARMAVGDALCRTVRATDSTRLLDGDAEITWDGRLDVIGIHYPEGGALATGTPRDTYPNASWIIPNDLDFLRKEGTNRSWRAAFVWDRPLSIGEYYCMDDFVLEGSSAYMGDEAFDAGKWRWQAWDGREAIMPRQDNAWLRMVKISSDRYRAAGVACLNPWTGLGIDVVPPLLVRPLDLHPNAFGGEPYTRRIFVANDTGRAWGGMHLQVGLLADGRALWSEERIPAHVEPGQSREIVVTLQPPQVDVVTPATMVVRLRHDYGPTPREIARHEETLWICPRASLADAEATAVALVDAAGGPTAKALTELGLAVTPGVCDDAALAGKRLLILGEGAMAAADLPAAARFAEAGGQVLVLHQEALEPFVPGLPELDSKHAASMTWSHDPALPALAGLADGQLRWWRPDHLVATRSLVRPSAGPAASAAASGGRFGMHWSPLATLRHGKGTVTLCQYLLSDRVAVEPAARLILSQAVRAALAAAPTEPAPALRLAAGIGKATRTVLADCSVWTVEGLEGPGPLLLDAATPPDASTLARLRAAVEAGGTLWLRGLNEKTLPPVAGLLPWTPGFAPLAAGDMGAARRSNHRLLAGLGTADFAWSRSRKRTAPLGGPALVLPSEGAATVLLEPALLVAVPLGKGVVLIDQLAWDGAVSAESERVTRIVSCLARNVGAGFRIVAGKRYRFTGLDLTAQANRGFVDENAGDGVGGWTDQGDNDLRYFLINHTGLVNGLAVPTQAFPTDAKFNGVAFRLIDPKANGGKAVVTLRGGPHDPAAPAEVRGIPVGGAKADRVWFLHAGCWAVDAYFTTIARYEVVYADGTRVAIPVRQGREISDWWNPLPLAGAQVAWSGRNEKHAPIGIYLMPWDNPSPEKPIAAIDVVGSLAETQLVLLGITLGVEEGDERTAAAWDCGSFAEGVVAGSGQAAELKGAGTPTTLGPRALLRLAGGQRLTTSLNVGPLAAGTPLAIEIEVAPEDKPGGFFGGLVEAGAYLQSGVRVLMRHDLKVVVEHFAGEGAKQATYLESNEPLAMGQLSTVRYEHDGRQARLLVNGKLQQSVACPPPAGWRGTLTVGGAGGQDYFLNGAVGVVRLLSLVPSTR
jgi:beta-galactosidase